MNRLFRPNNDRSILRNLITDREGWEKIAKKPFTEIKKTKLIDLNQQIDSFASKWAFKGLGVLWNPQFIKDLLTLKRNESNQSSGQKVFVQIWLHPLLLSLRVAKYCPAIGYSGGDMSIMVKAIDSLEDKLVVNETLRNLEVIEDSFHLPDNDDAHEEIEENNDEDNISNILEDLIVTEEMGVTRRAALDTSVKSNSSSLERQEAFDLEDEEVEEKVKENIEPKIEPKMEKSSCDGFDIRSILCGFRHEVDENIKAENEEKPKITIIGFHPPSSLPMERPNQQIVQLPIPTPLQKLGKTFADIMTRCVSHRALNTNIVKIELLEVRENVADNDGFTENLDPDYLKFLGQSFSSEPGESSPTHMSVVKIDTNAPPPAPTKSTRNNDDLDISLPPDLFNTSANDDGNAEPSIIRAAIE